MHPKTKLLLAELKLLRPVLTNPQRLQLTRAAQDKTGRLMANRHVFFQPVPGMDACYALPGRVEHQGVILYLHGGGYVAGSLDYAKGFGSLLAAHTGVKTLCAAYRLAPECPYPAALEDALSAYCYLLSEGTRPEQILLAGESAGGGLCFALCLKLRQQNLPLPGGVIAISPWADLTLSGDTLTANEGKDPMLTRELLQFDADCYCDGADPADPFISPLLGRLDGMPDSLLFAGGDERLLSDALSLHQKLGEAGCSVSLYVAQEMWHAYLLYPIEEAEKDMERLVAFVKEKLE